MKGYSYFPRVVLSPDNVESVIFMCRVSSREEYYVSAARIIEVL